MKAKKEYAIGDAAWVFQGDHKGRLREGRIVHRFKLDGWTDEQYVIELPTEIEPLLVIREWWSMSPAPDQPIGLGISDWGDAHDKFMSGEL